MEKSARGFSAWFTTITAARVLGKEKDLGIVDAGKLADMVIVAENPLDNLATLRNPVMVIKDGKIVFDARDR